MFLFKKKNNIHEECYDLGFSFIEWLLPRLLVFKKDAGKCVDLEFHTFEYKGDTFTQAQMLDKLIDATKYLLEHFYDWTDKTDQVQKEMLEIFSLIFPSLWW